MSLLLSVCSVHPPTHVHHTHPPYHHYPYLGEDDHVPPLEQPLLLHPAEETVQHGQEAVKQAGQSGG